MLADSLVAAEEDFVAWVHSFHFVELFVAGMYCSEPLVAKLVAVLALMATPLIRQHPKLVELFETELRRDLQPHPQGLEQFPPQLWHLRPAVLERIS